MFEGFARVWTPVAMARELRRDRPLAVQLAGTRLVLFRGRDGAPTALVDRCPHRGVALSLGRVQDGCLTCPFHGWRFDEKGVVCHVPWNPDAKTAQLHGVRVASREIGGLLWVYTAPECEPDTEPSLDEALLRPGVRVSGGAIDWDTHWTRAMENMLDWPHLPFVHGATIGRGMLSRPDARMDIRCEERPWGLHTSIAIDGEERPGSLDLRWPNRMNLFVGGSRRTLVMQVACVPIDAQRTRMILTTGRDFLRARLLDPLFHRLNLRIAGEDKAIVESSAPAEVPPAGDERSVRTDAPTLWFRKRYYKELRAPGPATGGPKLAVLDEAGKGPGA